VGAQAGRHMQAGCSGSHLYMKPAEAEATSRGGGCSRTGACVGECARELACQWGVLACQWGVLACQWGVLACQWGVFVEERDVVRDVGVGRGGGC
jgi:hypothetical protein